MMTVIAAIVTRSTMLDRTVAIMVGILEEGQGGVEAGMASIG